MYLPNSAFHDAFKDPTTYPQDLLIECATGFFSALDGDIESSGVEIEEYFCTSDDLSYGECPANTFKASLINRGNLRTVTWNDVWTVYIGVMTRKISVALPSGMNANINWIDGNTYIANTNGLYCGLTAIDTSGECYSLYASESLETLYAFGDGYSYAIDQSGYAQRITPPRFMIDKFRTPQKVYWDSDYEGEGWAYRERTYRDGDNAYKEEWKYIPMGTFFVEKPKNLSDAVVEIDGALDYMRNFDKEATHLIETINTAYPNGATVRQWVLATCTEAGAPSPIIGDVGADTYTLDPSTANTLRDILANLAECYNGVFRFNKKGEMIVGQIGTQAVEEIEPRRIEESSLDIAEFSTGTPDAVINKTVSGLTYVRGGVGWNNPYYILGNPFILNNDTVTLADVQFPPYRPMSFVVLEADPCVDVGDLIDVRLSDDLYTVLTDAYNRPFEDGIGGIGTVYTIPNKPLTIPLMHRILRWNGVCTATYECTGNEKRLEPYGAELTDYNSNIANDASNIINKIQAHGISADWIKTGTMDVSRDDKDDPLITVTAPVDSDEEYGVVKTEITPAGVSSTDSRYSDEEMTGLSAETYANVFGALDPEISVGFRRYGNNPYRSEILLDGSYSNPHIANEINGVERFTIDPDALTFRDANGNTTASYPSTGLHKLTPQSTSFTDNYSMTGAVINVPFLTNSDIGIATTASYQDTMTAWLKWVCSHYKNKQTCVFEGIVQRQVYLWVRAYIYQTNTVNSSGVPQYSSGSITSYTGDTWRYGTNNYANSQSSFINPHGDETTAVTSTTSMSVLKTLSLPAGLKLVQAEIWYQTAVAEEVVLTSDTRYAHSVAVRQGTMTNQKLSVQWLTTSTTVYVMGRWNTAGQTNNVHTTWIRLSD